MEELLHDLAAHTIQNRKVAFIENGSWASTSGKLMHAILAPMKKMTFLEQTVDIRSAVKPDAEASIPIKSPIKILLN